MRKTNLLLVIFLGATLLLLADAFTPLDIDSLALSLLLGGVAVATGVMYLGQALLGWRNVTQAVIGVALFATLAIGKLVFIWLGGWQTDTIEYQHRASANRTIEFQLMNPGAGSYRRRRVDRIRLLPGVSWTREIDDQNVDPQAWQRVDIEVNEMGLKYP